ncbi:hypothetical protein PPROV_000425300 [Pycnococcus provasolii]|uniref:Uncharacterized protein n=1 Tax=Pycnococcus provasolii TaxID=41880 RepID=A0A830HG58_9CHLO|nr:hypothetical protein PPROV_000425300 [Pycnococcus provasolii]
MAAQPPPPSTLLRLFLCEFSNRPNAESSHSYLKRKRDPGAGDDEHEPEDLQPSSGGLLQGQHSQDTPGAPLQDALTLQGQQGQGARGSFRTFEDARVYVRTLGLKSQKDWQAWSKSGKRPHDIPSAPNVTYASSGWTSYGDFLGYADGKVAGSYHSFEDARTYVRKLGLKSVKEWHAWSKSGARPLDIPSTPHLTYASSGWLSYPDFLGYAVGKKAQVRQRTDFLSFEDARAYVRKLGLKSFREWKAWSSSDARPHDIPSRPDQTYASSGWTSYGDFLGFAVGKSAVSTGSACIELIALPRSLKREPDDITPPQISQRFIVFDTPMLEMRYAAMYVAQMLREDGSKGVNDGDIELRLLSGDVVSLTEQTIRDVLALSASGTSASASASVHYSYRDTKRPTEEGSLQQGKGKINGYCAVKEEYST